MTPYICTTSKFQLVKRSERNGSDSVAETIELLAVFSSLPAPINLGDMEFEEEHANTSFLAPGSER